MIFSLPVLQLVGIEITYEGVERNLGVKSGRNYVEIVVVNRYEIIQSLWSIFLFITGVRLLTTKYDLAHGHGLIGRHLETIFILLEFIWDYISKDFCSRLMLLANELFGLTNYRHIKTCNCWHLFFNLISKFISADSFFGIWILSNREVLQIIFKVVQPKIISANNSKQKIIVRFFLSQNICYQHKLAERKISDPKYRLN